MQHLPAIPPSRNLYPHFRVGIGSSEPLGKVFGAPLLAMQLPTRSNLGKNKLKINHPK